MDVTQSIAIYGAILSTIAILWNIWKDINDNPKIKVSFTVGFFTFTNNKPQSIYTIEGVNTRKRPVVITSGGISVDKKETYLFINTPLVHSDTFPKKLNEGDTFNIHLDAHTLQKDLKNRIPKTVFLRDSSGKIYHSKNIKKLIDIQF